MTCYPGCGVCRVTHFIESLGLSIEYSKFFVPPSNNNLQPLVDARCFPGTRQIYFICTRRSVDDRRPKAASPEDSAATSEKNRHIQTWSKIKSLFPAPPYTSSSLGHHCEVFSSRSKPEVSGDLHATSSLCFCKCCGSSDFDAQFASLFSFFTLLFQDLAFVISLLRRMFFMSTSIVYPRLMSLR